MTSKRIVATAALAMIAFAGNSILCRLALKNTNIDPTTFTSIRMISGSLMLWLLLYRRRDSGTSSGSWLSAFALFVYAAGFSFAYTQIPVGAGALLLFGAVQATMITYAIIRGERLRALPLSGFVLAITGVFLLFLPGFSTPSVLSSALMLSAGIAWGVYSIRGRTSGDPTKTTADNFHRCIPFTLTLSAIMLPSLSYDVNGALLAVCSGAFASGIGYVIWYTTLKELTVMQSSTVQLSVPVLSAVGGVILLGEPVTIQLLCSATMILGGIGLVIWRRPIP
jgi:drug/metabolite transporter (DMT)-like permease